MPDVSNDRAVHRLLHVAQSDDVDVRRHQIQRSARSHNKYFSTLLAWRPSPVQYRRNVTVVVTVELWVQERSALTCTDPLNNSHSSTMLAQRLYPERGQHDVLLVTDNEIDLGAVLRHAQDVAAYFLKNP